MNTEKHVIFVDLDGTLAYHTSGEDYDPTKIGSPIPNMVSKCMAWHQQGHTVVVFTARAYRTEMAQDYGAISNVKEWLSVNNLPDWEVTCMKRPSAHAFWDDKAIRVDKNTGVPSTSSQMIDPQLEAIIKPHAEIERPQKSTRTKLKASDRQVGGDHYKQMPIQPYEFCYKNGIPGLESAVIGYVCRHQFKGGIKDVQKAIHLLEVLIEYEYER